MKQIKELKKLWPFGKKQAHTAKQQLDPTPMPPIKKQALLYLNATLAVLDRERIPLAKHVHGQPARGARFIEIPIRLNQGRVGPLIMRKVLNGSMSNAIQAAAHVDTVNIWQEKSSIICQYQLDQEWWKFYKRNDLPSPDGIGLGVGRTLVPFSLDTRHTLVAGETRSGKSVTVESILFALIGTYTQAEMGLVIVDPNKTMGIRKDGLKAIKVGSFTNAAHLLRPIAYDRYQIEEAINYVYQQWQHRMSNGIQDAPAIVLVIDELISEAVVGDKESGSHNEAHLAKLSQLASQGIKNNIFLIVGAQDPKIGNTSALLMRNLGLRFIGHVTDQNASRVLAGRGGVNAHLLTGRGDFIQVAKDSQLRFQVAEPTAADFDRLERKPIMAKPVGETTIINLPTPAAEGEMSTETELEFDLSLLVPNKGGRTEVSVDVHTLALYFYEKLSIPQAAEKYGLSRAVHTLHRDFARKLVDEIKHLQADKPSRSPYYLLQRKKYHNGTEK